MSIAYDLGAARWRKSSYSNGNGGNCVEVADGCAGVRPVRDSKNPQGPALIFTHAAWATFIDSMKADTPAA